MEDENEQSGDENDIDGDEFLELDTARLGAKEEKQVSNELQELVTDHDDNMIIRN